MLQMLASDGLRYVRILCVFLQILALSPVNLAHATPSMLPSFVQPDFARGSAHRQLSFELKLEPSTIGGAWIEYDALGASEPAHLRRVVNGRARSGGYVRYTEGGMHRIRDAISPAALIRGTNTVAFLPNDFAQDVVVSNVNLVVWTRDSETGQTPHVIESVERDPAIFGRPIHKASLGSDRLLTLVRPPDAIEITSPIDGSYYGGRALIQGEVNDLEHGGPKTVMIAGRNIAVHDGHFESIVDKPLHLVSRGPWPIEVIAEFLDGRRVVKKFSLFDSRDDFELSQPKKEFVRLESNADHKLQSGATLTVATADTPQTVEVTCGREIDVPVLLGALNNTGGGCAFYRVEMIGGIGDVEVRLPATLDGLPSGFDPNETRVFALNEASNAWTMTSDSFLDVGNKQTVKTLSDRSTTVLNGVLKAPDPASDQPQIQSRDTIASLVNNADPLDAKFHLRAPEPNAFGSAALSFPFMLRPVRGANQPRFDLTYDSSRGNGLAGDGWSLDVPVITVETKWGVPEFSAEGETETYLLNGRELVGFKLEGRKEQELPTAYRNTPIPRGGYVFRPRRDEQFEVVRRHGTGPTDYWWEVVYKNGNREYYGWNPLTETADESSVRRRTGKQPGIHSWGLTFAVDPDGNAIAYGWNPSRACQSGSLPADCQTTLEVASIDYNLNTRTQIEGTSFEAAGTRIDFQWERRADRQMSARYGVPVLQDRRLSHIAVSYNKGLNKFIDYNISYNDENSITLFKSLLSSITATAPADIDCLPYNVAGEPVGADCDPSQKPLPANMQVVGFEYFNEKLSVTPTLGVEEDIGSATELGDVALLKSLTSSALGGASALGTNFSEDAGSSLYVGGSPFPSKQFSAGGTTGHTERKTLTRSSLADLTGDGIPDAVFDIGAAIKICPGQRDFSPVLGRVRYPAASCRDIPVPSASDPLGSERLTSVSNGGESHLYPYVFFGGAHTSSSSTRGTYLADVDGNGLVDVVHNGVPIFNQGDMRFLPTSRYIHVPTATVSRTPEALEVAYDNFRKLTNERADELQGRFHPTDIIQTWQAPFTGVVALSGDVLRTFDGPRTDTATRMVVERSRQQAVERCAVSELIPANGTAKWPDAVSSCKADRTEISQAIDELAEQINDKGELLFAHVKKGDVLYLRENGDVEGRVDPGFLDVTIVYAALDEDPSRLALVASVVQSGTWDVEQLVACMNPGSSEEVGVPRCDDHGHSPLAYRLAEDVAFSASPQNDLLIPAQGQASFSGVLTFPIGSQPVDVRLLATTIPTSGPISLDQKSKDARSLFDPAEALTKSGNWLDLLTVLVPGECGSGTVPPVAGVSLSCSAGNVTVRFVEVPLDLCPGGCMGAAGQPTAQTRVRLAVRPKFGSNPVGPLGLLPSELDSFAAETAVFRLGDEIVDYRQLKWVEAPRLRFATNTVRPKDLHLAAVDAQTQVAMAVRAEDTQFVTPVYEGRYELTQEPTKIGIRQGEAYYQSIEINGGEGKVGERRYIIDKTQALGLESYDDPVVGAGGYRLPGDPTKCNSTDGLCEYRIAHVFFTDYPAFDDKALKSFNFDLRISIDGHTVSLDYLGFVDKSKCGENPILGYPSGHLKRSTDCGLQDRSLITADPKIPPKTIGIQFQLNDGNRVWGRDNIYAFRAKPGQILHMRSVVRPEWNSGPAIPGYISPAVDAPLDDRNKLHTCLGRDWLPRDTQALLEVDHRRDPCRPWVQLRSSEVRLSFEGGLGLADSVSGRKDFARLFVPVTYEEQFHRVPKDYNDFDLMDKRSFPAVATDHRGWSRFAFNGPLASVAPSYASIQFIEPQQEHQGEYAGSAAGVGVACTGVSATDCGSSAETAGRLALQERVHALRPTFWDAEAGRKQSGAAPAIASFTEEELKQANTCGGGTGVLRCYVGPDDDIWVALGDSSGRTEVAQYTGRLGPDDLAVAFADLGKQAPKAGEPSIPIPVLYTESKSRSGRVSLLSSVISDSTQFTQYLDLNGDGYPDPIVEETVGYTGPTGVPRAAWLPGTEFQTGRAHKRESQSRQQDLAYGIGNGVSTTAMIFGASPGDGNLGQTVGQDNAYGASTDGAGASTGGQSSPGAPFGLGLSLNASYGASSSRADLLDVNGDGLPDKIWLEDPPFLPGAGRKPSTLSFELNLGYGFAPKSSVALPDTAGSANASGGLGVNLGYNDGNGGWSGGVELQRTGSSSRNTLVDITGDGLVDLVVPVDGGYRVYVNKGTEFAQADESIFLKIDDWLFRDTAASETSVIGGGATFVIAIPLCLVSCYLIINPGMRREQAVGRNLIAIQDLNGDGLLDLATTPGFYQGYEGGMPKFGFPNDTKTKNYLNPLGKQNKLKEIRDATGAITRLDYQLVGNEGEQNPKGIWALSRVDIDDGFYPAKRSDDGDDRLSITVEYEDGRYDRHERAFLGFGTVKATYRGVDCLDGSSCPDASTQPALKEVTRTYLNGSVYDMGLLASEEISDDPAGSRGPRPATVARRDYAYDLWNLQDHPDPTRCGTSTAGKAQDDACLDEIGEARRTRTEQLTADVWNNPQRRLNPRLRAVRQVMTEAVSNRALRSLLAFDYDEFGNVATMVDFGQIRNAGETGDDSRDDYRVDLAYASIPTAPALEAGLPADSAIRDRVKRIVVHRGLAPSPLPDDVLRLREAIYEPQTGHLRTLCQYPKLTARMEELWTEPTGVTEGNEALCAKIDRYLATAQPPQAWAGFASVVGAYGLAPNDVVVSRTDAFDVFGTPHMTVSPFNAKGDRIETYRCFAEDPFALTPTASLQYHLRPDQTGLSFDLTKPVVDGEACKAMTAARNASLAEFRWSADVEPRMGKVDKSVDINGNTTFTHRDNWGRARTVLSDWGAPNSFSEHMRGPARAACAEFASRGAAVGSVDGKPECSVLLHVDYDLTDFGDKENDTAAGKLWSSAVQRYVLEDLYAGGSTQDDKAAIWQATFVDPVGKAIQANKEATVCVEAADLHAGPRPTSGIPELCRRQASGIASGWQAYDGLGRTIRSFYPQPIDAPSGWTRTLDEIVTVPHLADLSGAVAAAMEYDGLDRVHGVTLPDQNRLAYDFRLAPEPKQGLSRLRTIVLDSRCSAKALDRDARGLIGTVWEVQQKSFVKDTTAGGMTESSNRLKERNTCLDLPVAEFEQWATASETPAAVADGVAATRYDYDQLGQLRTIARPLGPDTIRVEYDLLGRRVRLGDPDRGDEVLTYDPMGSVVERDQISIRAVEPRKIRFIYDANRLVSTRYDAAWSQLNVDYAYDSFPENWTSWTPHNSLTEWLEDELPSSCRNCRSRLVAVRDGSGLTVRQYDVFGQITASHRSIEFEGQEIGRFRLRNEYDTWGQLRTERVEDLQPESVGPSCFNPRNPHDYLCDTRHTISYTYDQAAQPVGLRLDTRDVARLAYDEFGATAARWTGDGTVTSYKYDTSDRQLNDLSSSLSNAHMIARVSYAYDAGGNITRYQDKVDDPNTDGYLSDFSFEYDSVGRLTKGYDGVVQDRGAMLFPPGSVASFAEPYTYDLRHRIVTKGHDIYSYSDIHQNSEWKPTSAPAKIVTPQTLINRSYDSWGALESVIVQSDGRTNEARRLIWDPENRLTHVQNEKSGATLVGRYQYDYTGSRAVKSTYEQNNNATSARTLYVSPTYTKAWNGRSIVTFSVGMERIGAAIISNTAQKSHSPAEFYISYLPSRSVNVVTAQKSRGEHEGQLVQRLAYAPFGSLSAHQFYGTRSSARSELPFFAFAGKEFDHETGYIYFGARYYESNVGLWLAPDPALGAYTSGLGVAAWQPANLTSYSYAHNNPVNLVDPLGLWTWTQTEGVVRAVAGGLEMGAGATLLVATGWTGVGGAAGAIIVAHGADVAGAGIRQTVYNQTSETITVQGLQAAGLSKIAANQIDVGLSILGSLGSAGYTQSLRASSLTRPAADYSVWDTSITTAGSKYLNVRTNVTAVEFQENLIASGYKVIGESAKGVIRLTKDGAAYTIYTRSSTGMPGAQYFGPAGKTIKYSLGQ